MHSTPPPSLLPVFSGWRKLINLAGIGLWLISLIYFWFWWLDPEHIISIPRYIAISLILIWLTLLPAYFILIFAGSRILDNAGAPVPGRIAMVVTKTPSEPFSVVRKTLCAMLEQDVYQHDTWLADEDPSRETLDWCRRHRVQVSSRKNAVDYHRNDWPRRQGCKEGNLAYFYDHFGYRYYDFVSQFDADHVPESTYLLEIMRPFANPEVGYVSSPSICDANSDQSWAARGRLYVEASMHGSLQIGYNNGWAPLCIGSHYAVRTAALKQAGGLGPELAEDHSTTLKMNSAGWKGLHAVNAIAHGDGPATFADLAIQEFQWSRSLVTILLEHTPNHISSLRGWLKFQFLFSQLWYPMFSGFMAVMYIIPIWALVTGRNFVNITYIDFFLHALPVSLTLLLLAFWWRASRTFRPRHAKILSWEIIAFMFARWPWSLFGSLMAIRDRLKGSFVDFRITPKGARDVGYLPGRVLAPYAFLALVSGLMPLMIRESGTAAGFYLFAILNAFIYAGLLVLITLRHAIENQLPLLPATPAGIIQASLIITIALTPATATYLHGSHGLKALNTGIDAFTLTTTTSRIAGAGRGGKNQPIIRIKPSWSKPLMM